MILVDVYIPDMDKVYDFQVEETAQIGSVIVEMAEMIATATKSDVDADRFMLCSMDDNKIMQKNATLQSYGVVNGSRLMLV